MTTGVRQDLNLTQGASFYTTFTAIGEGGAALNISGYSGSCPIKTRFGATGEELGSFDFALVTPASGVFSVSITGADSAEIPCTQASYEVSLFQSGSSDPLKLYNGYLNIYPSV